MNKAIKAHYDRIRRAKKSLDKTKVCSDCGKRKSLTEFIKDPRKKDGTRNTCRPCVARYNRKDREQERAHPALVKFLTGAV